MNKQNSLLTVSCSVFALTLLGKVMGFAREILVAAYYGASAETDVFFFAQQLPGMIFPAICTGLTTAFISLYVKSITVNGEEKSDNYAVRMIWFLLLLSGVATVIGSVLTPLLVRVFAPGFSIQQMELAVKLGKIVFLAFPLTMLYYALSAVATSKQRFLSTATAGLVYNITFLIITILLGAGCSIETLTKTTIAANFAQTIVIGFFCQKGFCGTLEERPNKRECVELLRFAAPLLVGNSVVQINTIIDQGLGSMLPKGNLSALAYGGTLSTLVISIFVTTLATILYPKLTTYAASGDMRQYEGIVLQSLSGLSMLLIPIACITFASAEQIVSFVYGRGVFDQTDVSYTTVVLRCYAPMFFAAGIREILTRAFFALQDTKTPTINSAIGVVCNAVFSVLLVPYIGVAGIALGTTLSAFVAAWLLLRSTKKRIKSLDLSWFYSNSLKQILAGVCVLGGLNWLHKIDLFASTILSLGADAFLGISLYLLALCVFGHYRCMIQLFRTLHTKKQE